MENKRWVISLVAVWTGAIALFLYIPIFSVITSSFAKSRYFRFPVKSWSDKWYDETLGANITGDLHLTSFYVAGCVALIAVVLGFFGALAFARYNWRGRQFYQRLIMLPIFFPQAVLGLALLLWFTYVGVLPSWEAAAFAHLVWIVPIVTLVISIQVYGFDAAQEEAAYDLGASRWQAFREVTLPALAPGPLLWRALRLPAFVGQLSALNLHHGRRQHGDRVALHQDDRGLHADDPDHGRALGLRRHRHSLRRLHVPDRPTSAATGAQRIGRTAADQATF